MSLEEKFSLLEFDDGLGNFEKFQFLSYSILNNERKEIYLNFNEFLNEKFQEIYSVKYLKDEKVLEYIIILKENNEIKIIYCECGISYEQLSPSGFLFLSLSLSFI